MTIALYSRSIHVRDVAFIQKLLYTLRDRKINVLIYEGYYKELKQINEMIENEKIVIYKIFHYLDRNL